MPAAPCAGRVGAALQAGLLKSVENGKKSVQKSSSKEHHGSAEQGIMLCDHTGCFPRQESQTGLCLTLHSGSLGFGSFVSPALNELTSQ